MTKTQQLINLNRRAQAIAEEYPEDYHTRKDYRALVDQRSALQFKNKLGE